MEIIHTPHLPEKAVNTVLCGNCKDIENIMKSRGVDVINLSADTRLPAPIINHADIQCCHIGNGVIFTTNTKLGVNGYDVRLINEIPSEAYPNDCLLNCFSINGTVIAGKNCSKAVLEYAEQNSLETKFVNQGYSKCSTAIVSDDAVITADKSIANALADICNVLVIEQGHIKLTGYNYGFIGGACGKLDKDKLVFMGNPYKHTDGKRIISFTEQNNCEAVSLCNGELLDFGGFIPLFQN